MADAPLIFQIEVDSATGEARLKKFTQAVDDGAKKGQQSINLLLGDFSKLKDLIPEVTVAAGALAVGFAAISAVQSLVAGVKQFAEESIKAAAEAEVAEKKRYNALLNSGQATQVNIGLLDDVANSLQRVAGISDTAAIEIEAVAISMGLSAKEAAKVTQASFDMASALGTDAATAATALTKAILTGNVTALQRMGVVLTENEKKLAKQGELLDIVSEKFKGRAAQDADTFTGSVTRLKEAFGEFQEQIGNMIVQDPAIREVFNSIADLLFEAAGNAKSFGESLRPTILYLVQATAASLAFTRALILGAGKLGAFLGIPDDALNQLGEVDVVLQKIIIKLDEIAAKSAQPSVLNPPKRGRPRPDLGSGAQDKASGFGAPFGQQRPLGFDTGGASALDAIAGSLPTLQELLPAVNAEWVAGSQALREWRDSSDAAAASMSAAGAEIDPYLKGAQLVANAQLAVKNAFIQSAEAVRDQAAAYLTAAIAGGKAANSLGPFLATLSKQMFAASIGELAAGIAASSGPWGLAVFGNPAAHFKAAAVFGAAGAAFAVGSRLTGGPDGGARANSGGGGGGSRPRPTEAGNSPSTSKPANATPSTLYVVLTGQGVIGTAEEWAQQIGKAIADQNALAGR